MYAIHMAARLSLGIVVWLACCVPCQCRSALRGQLRLRSHTSTVAGCDCSNCFGQRRVTDTVESGFKGVQCKPRALGFKVGYCQQQGEESNWVVQSAAKLTYERFCYFTCKPVIPKEITPNIDCAQLTPEEAQLGQSPSGNGRAFIWHSNPLTDSVTLSELKFNKVEVPSIIITMNKAFGEVKAAEAAAKAAAEAKVVPTNETPPKPGTCMCKCPAPVTTTGALPPYNPFHTPPPLPARPPGAPGVPPPPPPPPVPPPPLPGPPPLPLLPQVLPAPMIGGPTPEPPPLPTLQPTPPPPPTTTFDWSKVEALTTTEPAPYFDHPFPERFAGEAPNKPFGPFAPTFPPTTPSPYARFFPTTPSFGAFGTTRLPYYMMLDVTQGDATPLPPSVEDPSFIGMTSNWLPPLSFQSMAMPGMPPMAFLQEMSSTFQSDRPVSGCDCACSNHDKHEESLLRAQQNAMDLMENSEDEPL